MSSNPPLARVLLTQTPYADQGWGGTGHAALFRSAYLSGSRKPFALVDDPDSADYIVFCEAYQQSESTYAPQLRLNELVWRFPEKVFVINGEDDPIGFLSGLYCSLPLAAHNRSRHRGCAYFGAINPRIVAWETRAQQVTPGILFSFVGAPTAAVRKTIVEKLATHPAGLVRQTRNLQFNVGVDDPSKEPGQDEYLRIILDSHFVLCPRGNGAGSFRLFETMRLGRVPVIMSDEWLAPQGPSWERFSLRIAESRVADLPRILEAHRHLAPEMGRQARLEWERWFAPDVFVATCLESIHALALARTHQEEREFIRWPEMIAQHLRSRRGVGPARFLARRVKAKISAAIGR